LTPLVDKNLTEGSLLAQAVQDYNTSNYPTVFANYKLGQFKGSLVDPLIPSIAVFG